MNNVKRIILLLLALMLCLSLCACSDGSNEKPTTPAVIIAPAQNAEDGTRIEVAYSNPITILDNDVVRIAATSKFSEYDKIYKSNVMAYVVSIENKTDQFVNLVITDCSIDGYMVGFQDGPYFSVDSIAPGKKANGTLTFYIDRMTAVELKTLEDMKNVDGLVQIGFSNDGNAYSNHTKVPFDNILP